MVAVADIECWILYYYNSCLEYIYQKQLTFNREINMKIIITLRDTKGKAKEISELFKDIEEKYKDNPLVSGFDIK